MRGLIVFHVAYFAQGVHPRRVVGTRVCGDRKREVVFIGVRGVLLFRTRASGRQDGKCDRAEKENFFVHAVSALRTNKHTKKQVV